MSLIPSPLTSTRHALDSLPTQETMSLLPETTTPEARSNTNPSPPSATTPIDATIAPAPFEGAVCAAGETGGRLGLRAGGAGGGAGAGFGWATGSSTKLSEPHCEQR